MAVILKFIRQAILIALLSVISISRYSQTLPIKEEESKQATTDTWYNNYDGCSFPVTPIFANKTSNLNEICGSSRAQKEIVLDACKALQDTSSYICTSHDTNPKNNNYILDPDAIYKIVENGAVCSGLDTFPEKWMTEVQTLDSFLQRLKSQPDLCSFFCQNKNYTYLCALLLNGGDIVRNMQENKAVSNTERKPEVSPVTLNEVKITTSSNNVKEEVVSPLPNKAKSNDEEAILSKKPKLTEFKVETLSTTGIPTNPATSDPAKEESKIPDKILPKIKPPTEVKDEKGTIVTKDESITVQEKNSEKDIKTDIKMAVPKQQVPAAEDIVTTAVPKYDISVKSAVNEVTKENADNTKTSFSLDTDDDSENHKPIESSKTVGKDVSTIKDLERKDFKEENGKTDVPELSGGNTKTFNEYGGEDDDNEQSPDEPVDSIINPEKEEGQSNRRGGSQDVDTEFTEFSGYTDSHFFSYILTISVLCIIVYLIFHNKQKILAIVVEGWKGQERRRNGSRGADYKLLR